MRFALFSLLALGCADVGASRQAVQYGPTDDRVEVYEAPAGPLRAVAESAVAMQLGAGWIDETDPSDVRVTYTDTLSTAHDLCPGVRYEDQIEPGTCSGTLIDDQHILTAGHCVDDSAEDCDGATWPWLFGFYFEAAGRLRTLTHDDVYYCTRIVAYQDDAVTDFAVIELDRPVVGHAPAQIRSGARPPDGTRVTLIGHPNGIPMKIAGNASLRGMLDTYILADVDAFSGNSGSGVFDDAGQVVGILVAGNDDWQNAGGCNVIDVIDPVPDGDGEQLTPVGTAIDAYCATGAVSPVCGDVPDAGSAEPDAGTQRDASTRRDAGTTAADASASPDAGNEMTAAGCGCRASPGGAHGGLLAIVLVMTLARRRRGPNKRT